MELLEKSLDDPSNTITTPSGLVLSIGERDTDLPQDSNPPRADNPVTPPQDSQAQPPQECNSRMDNQPKTQVQPRPHTELPPRPKSQPPQIPESKQPRQDVEQTGSQIPPTQFFSKRPRSSLGKARLSIY